MAKVAVVGPGAVGCTVAAELARAHDVLVCARTPFDRLEVETPLGMLVETPRTVCDVSLAEPVDWVLVATKAYDHVATGEWMRALAAKETRFAILQNGVEHVERFAPYVDAARIVPIVVDCSASRLAPGRVRLRRPASLIAPKTDAGEAFVALFEKSGIIASTSTNFTTALFQKLCLNSVGAVPALLLQPANIANRDAVAALMHAIASECVAVGRKEGATLPDDLAQAIVLRMQATPSEAVNSLHSDRLRGRPMEIDARNGAIVRLGKRHGIATPLNQAMVALLEAVNVRN